jgi:multidrug transporter EmrE-like cation transporter
MDMFPIAFRPHLQSAGLQNPVILLALFGVNLFFNIVANASFKLSATSASWNNFLVWQVVGNLAGFITVLTLTGLLRFIPLGVAYPVTTGLAVVGVQVIASGFLFHDPVSPGKLLGTLFVVIGIGLIGTR